MKVNTLAHTIAVSDEIYDLLKKQKLSRESFSDVIRRLASQRGPLMELAGQKTIPSSVWAEIQQEIHKAEQKSSIKMGSH